MARLILTQRDVATLVECHLAGCLGRVHVEALCGFGSIGRANARLKSLVDGGYLRRGYVAAGPNATKAVYGLGPEGVSIVSERLAVPLREVRRRSLRELSRSTMEHSLLVADVVVSFAQAAAAFRLARRAWEVECRHEYRLTKPGGGRERHVLRPDAFIEVEGAAGPLGIFVEADRGHVGMPQWRSSVAGFARYRDLGLYAASFGRGEFGVAVVTTAGLPRLRRMAAAVRAHAGGVPFAFVSADRLVAEGAGAAIWLDPRLGRPVRIAQALSLGDGGGVPPCR